VPSFERGTNEGAQGVVITKERGGEKGHVPGRAHLLQKIRSEGTGFSDLGIRKGVLVETRKGGSLGAERSDRGGRGRGARLLSNRPCCLAESNTVRFWGSHGRRATESARLLEALVGTRSKD